MENIESTEGNENNKNDEGNTNNIENTEENNEDEPITENNNAEPSTEAQYTDDTPIEDVSFNNDNVARTISTSGKVPPPQNMEGSLPNQIVKDEPKGSKENTTDFNFSEMFDKVDKDIENEFNNKDTTKEAKPKGQTFNHVNFDLNIKDDSEETDNINSFKIRFSNLPLKHNRIVNIEDGGNSSNFIRVFHKSESLAENINNIENSNRMKNKFNKPKRLGLSNIRNHSTFIADTQFNMRRREFKDLEKDNDFNSLHEVSLSKLDKLENRSNSTPNLNIDNSINELRERRKKLLKKESTYVNRKKKLKGSFSSALDLLLYNSHENIGYIDKIMLQKMNNTSKSRNVINSSEFKTKKDNHDDECYYYPIEFTDNVEGRKLYYEYKIRKSMSSEPLIIHRRNLLFVICLLLTLFLLGILIYDYHSLLIKEKNSIFFGWINAIYILHIVDISIALLAYIYANESGKPLFTAFTIILGIAAVVVFILRFIFTWSTKNLIPIDYK